MLGMNTCKKGIICALTACLVLGSTAYAEDTPAFQDATEETDALLAEFEQANSMKALLKRHSAFLDRVVCYKDGEAVGKIYSYGDPESYIYEDSSGYSQLMQPTLVLTRQNGKFKEYLLESEEAYTDQFESSFQSFAIELCKGEKATSYAEDEDYTYLVSEAEDAEAIEAYFALVNQFVEEDAYTLEEGDLLRFHIAIEKEDLDFARQEVYLVGADGEEELLLREERIYEKELSVDDTIFADYFGGQTRQFIIITDPGTAQEKSMSYTVPRGVSFDVYFDGEFPEVYTDEECTKPLDFSGTAQLNDCYLYISTGVGAGQTGM